MYTEKYQVLQNVPGALNRQDLPWEVTVEGDCIIARWRWMDATFFAPHEVNNETRQYTHIVTLTDKGTWKEKDLTEEKSAGISFDGKNLSFGKSTNKFAGKTSQKSVQFGIGKNNQSGEVGIVGFKFDTTPLKQSIRDYLTYYGWKKAGLFG